MSEVTPVTPPAPVEPAPVAPAAAVEPDPIAGMTPEQLDTLAARIAETRANRPASLIEQFTQLQDQLTGAHRTKEAAVETRKAASTEADDAVKMIAEIRETMRRTELTEAAQVAGFKAPSVVAATLANREGDIATLIAEAAATGAWAMNAPAKSAPIGGPGSQTPAGMDPGRAALIAEIAEATGR